jgi:hypothetical protein
VILDPRAGGSSTVQFDAILTLARLSGPDGTLRVMFRAALRAFAVAFERLDPHVVCLDVGGIYVRDTDAAAPATPVA